MTKLEDRLRAIAHMMDQTPGYASDEARIWKALIRHVDLACFERTGKLIVTGLTPKALANQLGESAALTIQEIDEVLGRLATRRHLAIEAVDLETRYRLFLFRKNGRPV